MVIHSHRKPKETEVLGVQAEGAQRAGMVRTLVEALRNASTVTGKGYTFLDDALAAREWSFADLYREAVRRGSILRTLGLEKGDRVAMIVPEGEDFILTFFGAVVAGLVPVPMYPPLALGKIDSYVESAARIIDTAKARMLVTTKQVVPVVGSLLSRTGIEDLVLTETIRTFDDARITGRVDDVEITPDDPCFLQFTSGSTSDPKGVVVSHANLVANATAIVRDGLAIRESDRGVSWLPLYHDMGLIGFVIAPLLGHVPIIYIPTLTFVKRPHVWMEVVSKYRGTITFAPNFAFGLAAKRAHARKKDGFDLSCIRVLGCGAEPINAKTMRTFVEAFAPFGLRPESIMPCYGMAEATLAISFADTKTPFRSLTISRTEYEGYHLAVPYHGLDAGEGIELVSCGSTFRDHEVAIMGEGMKLLGEGEVGEIVVRGPSVTRGYFENPKASERLLAGGWLHTGDLGFVYGGDLYISGRQKDLIILNGRNYYPQVFEWEVEQIDGVRRGNVVACSRPGEASEELVIVAEVKERADRTAVAEAIRKQIHDTSGVRVRDVLLVGPGALPKTSSGKLQRSKTRQLYLDGGAGFQGNRSLGSTATKVALARHITRSALARVTHSIKKRTKVAVPKWTAKWTARRAETR
jgi:fatty-acyl-CoA synthase